ncbi:MAG TPA: hypothetical protein VKH42_07240 [Vicinamibacterales bacterium]|nr:hypothetical protein [Vicinamibacterales bacterium]
MDKRLWMAAAMVVVSTASFAQDTREVSITSPPPNIIVPNYNGIPTGPLGGLEGSAHIARAGDTSAPWFNPAGLSQAGTQLSGSVGNYQFTTVTPARLPDTGGSTQHLPNLVGATVKWKGFTAGFAMITTIAWGSGLNSVYTLTNAAGNPERFSYTADSGMSQRVTAGAVGYDINHKWRVGAGVALTSTSITSEQIISDRIDSPTGYRTLLFTSRASGSIDALRGVVGVQYVPVPAIRFGLMARSPGIEYGKSGSVAVDSTLDGGGPSIGASVSDTSATFEYKLPYELAGGFAVIGKRAELEFDVKGYTAIDPYALLSSSKSFTIYRDPGTGGPGATENRPFPSVTSEFRAVTNFAGGGHVQVLTGPLPLTLHAGVGTDHSPVPTHDAAVFGQVDFMVYTAGISGALGQFKFAFGVNSRRGSIDNLVLQNLITGPVQASLQIKTLGITYALNYKF